MTLFERIDCLGPVLAGFPEMKGWDVPALRKLARDELGADEWIFPQCLLHVISANTPMAGLQSLVRGLILGSLNHCKIPSAGLPLFKSFVRMLPPALAELVNVSSNLEPGWLNAADAIVVFGTDATVDFFHRQAREDQIFAGYGDRWSGAVIFEDTEMASIPLVTRDVCLYGQRGCLSAQVIWLQRSIDPLNYGARLAEALAAFSAGETLEPLTSAEASSVARWRGAMEWQAVIGTVTAPWFSAGEPVSGVVLLAGSGPAQLTCLHRHVTLVPFDDVPETGDLGSSLSTLGVWPEARLSDIALAATGASRFCPVGQMQFPTPDWQQDGFPALRRLLRPAGGDGEPAEIV